MNLNAPKTGSSRTAGQTVRISAALRTRSTTSRNVPVVAGLCLPQGQLEDAVIGDIEGFSVAVPAQFEVLNRWNDGSVRWMVTSFVAPEVNDVACGLRVVANSKCDSDSVFPTSITTTVKLIKNEISVVTRDLSSDPPGEFSLRLKPCLCDAEGNEIAVKLDGVCKELVGQVRQTYVVSAHVQSMPFITLQLRLHHWMSVGLLQVETRIRNSRRAKHLGGLWDLGDAGSFLFGSLEISIRSDEVSAAAINHWRAERRQAPDTSTSEVFLRQLGSGGPNWNCSNHVNASGKVAVTSRGYELSSEKKSLSGLRAEPTFMVADEGAFLGIAIPEFWQTFPSSAAAVMGRLEVGVFPSLPTITYELQGGEQKTQSFWVSCGSGVGTIESLDWVFDPPRLLQSATSIRESNSVPWFFGAETSPNETSAPNEKLVRRFAQYLCDATTGAFRLSARRDSIDEYGWRNYGDIPADHEQTHYAGCNTIVSHYNNQFDMIFGGILQLAATSDLKWFDLLDPLARHVMDIDVYHTDGDRAAFNGGLFWHTDHYVDAHSCTHRTYSRHNQKPGMPYGGGPSCEHNYTTGLLYYYFLTGNFEARDTVVSLADWVIQMDDGRNTIFGLLDSGPTGAASATVFEDFHGPGRGAGNSINALLDAWLLTNDNRYLSKLEELIRRCVHPEQNPGDLHLLDAEGHWSYTVFMNSLGRYLIAKRDAEMFDVMYTFAHDVMKTYGRWMSANECRTLDHPDKLQYPTEAWAAQDFRKANVLRIAASCESDPVHAAAMRVKADLINDAAWADLETFGDARFTARCLSILLTEGHREIYHRTGQLTLIPECSAKYDFGPWSMFVPQKHRVRNLLRSPSGLIKSAFSILNPRRLVRTWKALRRQM